MLNRHTLIIVNWNSWDILSQCLEKLEAQTFQSFNVLVVDNASEHLNQARNKLREVFSPCAAAGLYRRDALMSVGGFDEDFFIIWLTLQGRVVFRAKRDALLGVPKMWRKRQQIQKARVASIGDIWRVLDNRLLPTRGKT